MIGLYGGRMGFDIDFGNISFNQVLSVVVPTSFLPKVIYIQAHDSDHNAGKSIGIGKVGSNQCIYNTSNANFSLKPDRIYFCDNGVNDNLQGYISAMTPTSFTLSTSQKITIVSLLWIAIR